MKFAQKISSRRRSIWNAWSACSPASPSTPAASGARSALAGWTSSPHASSRVVTGGCASQWTSRPGTSRRSSRAIATSRQAWPSPIGDETSSARRGRAPAEPPAAPAAARAARSGAANSWISRLTSTGWRALGMWPAPTMRTCSAPVSSAKARPRSNGWQLSRSPWTTSTGQRTRAQISSTSSRFAATGSASSITRSSDRTVEPVRDGVLDLLRRMRLGEHLAEEELEEAAMVGADGVAVLLLPALGRVALLVEGLVRGDAPRVARDEMRDARGERDEAEHALRVRGGDLDRGPDAVAADAGEHGRLGRRGVHHRQAVGRVPAVQPRPRRVRRCRSARSRGRHRRRRDGGGRGSAPAPSRCASG